MTAPDPELELAAAEAESAGCDAAARVIRTLQSEERTLRTEYIDQALEAPRSVADIRWSRKLAEMRPRVLDALRVVAAIADAYDDLPTAPSFPVAITPSGHTMTLADCRRVREILRELEHG